MKFIKITSKGEIDIRAFSKMGASSKRADGTKIGMFGSGLKYSLAYLLRKDVPFKVFSGYREINFSTKEDVFRDKIIHSIYINGRETDLTTDMGMDWEHWFVIREIYCNALDETEASISIANSPDIESLKPIEDFTTFYIKVDAEFEKILNDWDLYFSENRRDVIYKDLKSNQIYSGGESLIVYRKGIRCHFVQKEKSLFNYDLSWVEINESRVLKSEFMLRYDLVGFLRAINDNGIVHRILYNINDCWEKCFDWNHKSHIPFSDTWTEIIGEKYLIPYENGGFWDEEIKYLKDKCIILPNNLIEALKLQFGDKVKVIGDDATNDGKADKKVINELNKREQYLLDEAVKFLNEVGYEIKYPIKVCKFFRTETLGQALDETIFLSDKLFTMGKREIINTIIEENQHLKTGFKDETRAMQTDLINLAISFMEEKLGRYL